MRAMILAMLLGLLAACGEPATTVSLETGQLDTAEASTPSSAAGPSSEPTAEPTATASSQALPPAATAAPDPAPATPAPEPTGTGPRELGQDENAEIGRPYRFRLYTHCGIATTWWNGAWWDAEPPQDDGNGNPPPRWGNPYQDGVMVQVSETRLEFTGDEGQRATFIPRPESQPDPPPCA